MMDRSCTLYIARHGEAVMNHERIIMGQLDSPLNDTGRKQALHLTTLLKGMQFDAVLTSDLQRAIDTARIITGLPIEAINVDMRLRERNFGSLEGHAAAELEAARALQRHLIADQRWSLPVAAGAESDKAVFERTSECIKDYVDQHSGDQILVVSHSGPIRSLLIGFGLLSANEAIPGFISHGQYIVITMRNGQSIMKGIYPSESITKIGINE